MRMTKAIKRWGNSYGISLTKGELANLGLGPGDEVDLALRRRDAPHRDLSDLPVLHSGRGLTPAEMDEIVAEETWEGHLESTRQQRPGRSARR